MHATARGHKSSSAALDPAGTGECARMSIASPIRSRRSSAIIRLFNVTAYRNSTNQLNIDGAGQILSNGKNHIGTPTQAPGSVPDQ
jgi:hypothetical protein